MNNKVKFLRGTSSEYAVAEKDSDTIYFTTDDGKLYIGDKEISGSDVTIDDTLSNTSTNPVQNKVVKQAIDNKADKTVATTSANGLMSAVDKSKLDSVDDTYALKSLYGDTTIDVGRKADTTIGTYSTAEGSATTASGDFSHAEGVSTTASGVASHAEGVLTTASGDYSHSGGAYTEALHECEVAYGRCNESNDNTLFSVGDGTSTAARHNAFEITKTGGKLHDKDIATTDIIPDLSAYAKTADVPNIKVNSAINADTVGGKSKDDFSQIVDFGYNATDTKTTTGHSGKTSIYRCNSWTDYPAESPDGQGTVIVVNYSGSGTVGIDTMWIDQFFISAQTGVIYKRHVDNTIVGQWKEISTTPIKSTDIFGTTNQYGNLLLWKVTDNRKPILVTMNRFYAIPFLTADADYYYYYASLINCETHDYITNTPVSGTIYYIEL